MNRERSLTLDLKNGLSTKSLLLAIFLLVFKPNVHGQVTAVPDTIDIYEMTIEQLQQIKAYGVSTEMEKFINSVIEGSSKKAFSYRESPNTISLITAEEIEKSGARNMADLLRTVAGIDIGVDVQGALGVGIRGLWAFEAKMLFILNGMEINEPLYGTALLNSGFNLNNIKRIEIIRGPGSVIYGGKASNGIVNIITKDYEGDCFNINTSQGFTENGYSSNTIGFSISEMTNKTKVNVSTQYENTILSDRNFIDLEGDSIQLRNFSNQESFNTSLTLQKNQLTIKYFFSNNKITSVAPYDLILGEKYFTEFLTNSFQVKNKYKLSKKSEIAYSFGFLQTTPWKCKAYEKHELTSYHSISFSPRLNMTYNQLLTKKINISAGSEYLVDFIRNRSIDSPLNFPSDKVNMTNLALFTELSVKWRPVNLFLGVRYDRQNFVGDALAPRIALTGKLKKLNYKLIGSRSFKTPSFENINLSNDFSIRPEFTNYSEFELGYNLSKIAYFCFNLFDIETKNPIVYDIAPVSEGGLESYSNYGFTVSQGFELEYSIKTEKANMKANYSYYTARDRKNDLAPLPTINFETFAGFANHKIALSGYVKIIKNISFGSTAQYFSPRYAKTGTNSLELPIYTKLNASFLLNANLIYNNILCNGLDLRISASNITNSNHYYIQPYDGDLMPIPNLSREYSIKLSYTIQTKK